MMDSSSIPANEAEAQSTKVPNWLELPRDITSNILQRIDTIEMFTNTRNVCPLWWNICKDPLMWRTIDVTTRNCSFMYDQMKFDKIIRYAVERSCGLLTDVDIEYICTDELLEYIAHNGSNIRRMRLVDTVELSDKGIIDAVKKLPQLEMLDITLCTLSKESLEVIGRSLPLLKSFRFFRIVSEHFPGANDDEALIISETMSGLSHLALKGNSLTNVGLLAILDGCPLLKSLEIEMCINLDLNESIRKRCSEQIKDFRLPTITRDNYVEYHTDNDDEDEYYVLAYYN